MGPGLFLGCLLAWSSLHKAQSATNVPNCTLGARHIDQFDGPHQWPTSDCSVQPTSALSFAVTVKRVSGTTYGDFLCIEEATDTNSLKLVFNPSTDGGTDFAIWFAHVLDFATVQDRLIPSTIMAVNERKRIMVTTDSTYLRFYVEGTIVLTDVLSRPLASVNRYVQYGSDTGWTGAITDVYIWGIYDVPWADTARIRTPLCELAGSSQFSAQTSQTYACPSFGDHEFSFAFTMQRLGGTLTPASNLPQLRFNPLGSSSDYIEVGQATDTQIVMSGTVTGTNWAHILDTGFATSVQKRFLVSIDSTTLRVVVDGGAAVDTGFPGGATPALTDRSVIIGPAASDWVGGVQDVMVWPFFEVSWAQALEIATSTSTTSTSSSSRGPFYFAGGSYDTSKAHDVFSAVPDVGNPPGFSIAFTLEVSSQSSDVIHFIQLTQPSGWDISVTSQPTLVHLRWKVPGDILYEMPIDTNFPAGVRKQFLAIVHSAGATVWTDGVLTEERSFTTAEVEVLTASRSLMIGVQTAAAVTWVGSLTDVYLWPWAVSSWGEAQLPTSTATSTTSSTSTDSTSMTTSTTATTSVTIAGASYYPGGYYTSSMSRIVVSDTLLPVLGNPPGFSVAFTYNLVTQAASSWNTFLQLKQGNTGTEHVWFQSQPGLVQMEWEVPGAIRYVHSLHGNFLFDVPTRFLVIVHSTGITLWVDGVLANETSFTTAQLSITTVPRKLIFGPGAIGTAFAADVLDVYVWPRAVSSWADAQLPVVSSTSSTSSTTTSVTLAGPYYNPGGQYSNTHARTVFDSGLIPELGNPPGISVAFTLKLITHMGGMNNFMLLRDASQGEHMWFQCAPGRVQLQWQVHTNRYPISLHETLVFSVPTHFLVIIHSTGISVWVDGVLASETSYTSAQLNLKTSPRSLEFGPGVIASALVADVTDVYLWPRAVSSWAEAGLPAISSTSSTTGTDMGTSTQTWGPMPGITPPDCRFFGGDITDTVWFDYTSDCPLVWSGAFTIVLNIRADTDEAANPFALFEPVGDSSFTNAISLRVNAPIVGTWTFGSHSQHIEISGFTSGVEYSIQWQIGEDGSLTVWRDGVLTGSGGDAGSIVVSASRSFHIGRGHTAPNMVGAVTNIMAWNSAPCDLPLNNCPTTSTTTSGTTSTQTWGPMPPGMTPPDCRFFGGDTTDTVWFDYTSDCPLVWSGAFTISLNIRADTDEAANPFALFQPVGDTSFANAISLAVNSPAVGTWIFGSHSQHITISGFTKGVEYGIQWQIGEDGSLTVWRDGVLAGSGGGAGSIVVSASRSFHIGRGHIGPNMVGAVTNIMAWNSAPCDLPLNTCPTTSTTTSGLTETTTTTPVTYWSATRPDCYFAGGNVSGTAFDYTSDCTVVWSGGFTIGFDIQTSSSSAAFIFTLYVLHATPEQVMRAEVFDADQWRFASFQSSGSPNFLYVGGFVPQTEYRILFSISADGAMRVWRDGVLVGSTGSNPSAIVASSSRAVHMGGRNWAAQDVNMQGSIRNIHLWNSEAPCDLAENICPSTFTSTTSSSLTRTTVSSTTTLWLTATPPDCSFAGGDVSGAYWDFSSACQIHFGGAFTIGIDIQVLNTNANIGYHFSSSAGELQMDMPSTASTGVWRWSHGSHHLEVGGFEVGPDYRIVFSIDEAGNMRLWRDGVLAGTASGAAVISGPRSILIGRRDWHGIVGNNVGFMRNIKLWNSAPCDVTDCPTTTSSSSSATATMTSTVTSTTSSSSTTSWSMTTTSSSSSSTTSSVSLTTSTTATVTSTRTPTTTSSSSTSSSSTSSISTISSSTSSSMTSSSTTSTTGTNTTLGITTTSTTMSTTTSITTTGTSTTGTSTTSTSQTSSVTSTTRTSTATTTDTVTTVPGLTTTTPSAADLAEAAVGAAVSNILAQGLADGETATVETPLGTVQVFSLGALVGNGTSAVATEGGSKVAASAALVEALPEGAVLSLMGFSGGGGSNGTDPGPDPFEGASGGNLASPSLDISVCTPSGCISVTLVEPLIFRLPDPPGGATTPGDQKCAFITKSAAGDLMWSTEGVARATAAQIMAIGEDPNDGIWCATMHLSVFGAIFNLIAGCTNIELFTPEGFRAITENEGWYRSNAAGITGFILCLLATVAVAADVVECWRFRYGKTHESWKHMKLCSNFLAWGPQLLKHRYAVFVVYARDVIACITSGHSKLRNASLLSSVQRLLAARTHISVACVSAHCWNGAGWLETRASLPHIVVSHKLRFHGHVAEDVIRNCLTGFSPYKVILRFVTTCWAVHPLVDSTRLGPGSVTVHKRTALQLAGIVGVVATNAAIFNFSGELRSWEADATCPISPSSLWFIAVATVVSVSVNAVPNAFLMDIAKQVHGRPGWIAFFWILYATYFAIGMAFLFALLANLNAKEQDKWYKSLEWSMSFKLFGMPMAQGLRHWLMLEIFLMEDRNSKESHFNTSMGFKHPEEIQVTGKGKEAAELMAKSAISLEELLTFAALLGDKVMPEYNPETSTSEEVLLNAIRPLCVDAPQCDHPLLVEVVELYGLDLPHSDNSEMKLSCSVYHLSHKTKGQRLCLLEEKSSGMTANEDNNMMRYAWNFEAKLDGVKLEHAIGFAVHEGTRVLGIAWLPMEDLIKGQGYYGELRLQPLGSAGAPEKGKSFCEPSEASPVPAHDVLTGSNRLGAASKLSISELTRLVVKVSVSDLCLKSLALQELRKIKELRPDHPSEMLDGNAGNATDVRRSLVKLGLEIVNDERAKYSSTAFCEPAVHLDSNDTNNSSSSNNNNTKGSGRSYVAPKRIVVHSWKGLFSHLVAMVTSDALAMEDGYHVVLDLAHKFDYHTILDLLVEKGCQGARYWIDLFAIDPANFEMESNQDAPPETPNPWHEGLLTALPTIFRDIRRNSCLQMATDLEEEQKVPSVPLIQLLILDRNFHFLRESNCLAEMMLAKSMRFRQRLVLHPKHLEGGTLGAELSRLADELGDAFQLNELPWTTPFLENKQAVYDTVKDLAVASVKEARKDEESTWQELSMTNLVATVGGLQAGQSSVFTRARDSTDAGGADDLGAAENGDVDVD